MSWVTILWSMVASACLTLAALHALAWRKDRTQWAHLAFALTAVAVAGTAAGEFLIMRARTPAEMGVAIRWTSVPAFLVVAGIVCFVQLTFRTGKVWLGGAAVGLRFLTVLLNFTSGPTDTHREIITLRQVELLGEPVSVVAEAVANPWVHVSHLSSLLLLGFVADATARLWRTSERQQRRRALVLGGSILGFILLAAGYGALVNTRLLQSPYLMTFPLFAIVVAINFELSRDIRPAGQLFADLRESALSMSLAAETAGFGVWIWNIARNEFTASERWLRMFGFAPDAPVTLEGVLQRIHPDDRATVGRDLRRTVEGGPGYAGEYRVTMPDGTQRWMAALGRMYPGASGRPSKMLGATIDVTGRKQSTSQIIEQRDQLTHLARVAMLGQMSGSLAHELNQPLTAILSNAQAAQRFLAIDNVDLDEVREILKDIVTDDQRAGEVIRRLRLLLKKGELHRLPLDLNDAVQEVLHLVRNDLLNDQITLRTEFAPDLPIIEGDRVQLEQVLLNFIVNATEAMQQVATSEKELVVRTERLRDDGVRLSVSDTGSGIAPNIVNEVFDAFVTTKPAGMGLGLKVCRTIIEAHGGRLGGKNNPVRGATFHFEIPATQSRQA